MFSHLISPQGPAGRQRGRESNFLRKISEPLTQRRAGAPETGLDEIGERGLKINREEIEHRVADVKHKRGKINPGS